MPIFILPKFIDALSEAIIENGNLRIPDAVLGWAAPMIIESTPIVDTITNNQTNLRRKDSSANQKTEILDVGKYKISEIELDQISPNLGFNQHGLVKSVLMCLGISHCLLYTSDAADE